FAAYGAAQAGRDYHTVDLSEITLHNTYLPPFKAAVEEGAATFMTAFNELFGVPATGSQYLLQDLLRDEWGFNGFVVTDYTSINEMVLHGFAKDDKHAGELAIAAGVDMDMQGAVFYDYLEQSIEEGKASLADVDRSVRRILTLKFELGLFDDPYRYSDASRQENLVMTPEHLEFARDFSRRSIVLLKNEHQTLPLGKDIRSIAVIGPLADNQREMLGSWSAAGDYSQSVTLLQGIKNALPEATAINYAQGAEIDDDDTDLFAGALNAARNSDAIVLAIGEYALMSGEAASRSDIGLPGAQEKLALELAKLGKPLVVVLMNGRPLTIENLSQNENIPSILEAWFLGTTAGDAIADVLFGDYNPSGKLPVTFPRNVGQIPIFYNHKNTGRPKSDDKYTSKYIDVPNSPLYPFGYGLSYTTFSYSDITLSAEDFLPGETLEARITVTNTGDVAGEEVVQLYTRDLVGSITRPVKELRGFSKIMLQAGESKELVFTLSSDDLAFYNGDLEFAAEPGDFQLFIGGNSEEVKQAAFSLRE
ncbi:MAG: glycoside hydrolase family 3 C-terminal domain-containing protein, partial [Bacteroidales bacterium]